MPLTAKQAADAVGISKNGIIKAIREGRISGTKNAKGGWEVEASELFRVYQPVDGVDSEPESPSECSSTPSIPPNPPLEISLLEQKLEMTEQRLSDKDEVIEDLRQQLAKVTEIADRQTRLLESQSEKPTEKPVEGRKRFLWW